MVVCVIVVVVDVVGCLGLCLPSLSVIMLFWRVCAFITFVQLWVLSEKGVHIIAFLVEHMFAVVQ